ncbi:hypothetical protein [Circoviridae sp.]|nr:hypothetical protein [Circoviridae sp.]
MSAYHTPKRSRSNSFSSIGIGLARSAGGALLSGLHGVARNLGSDMAASAGNLIQDASHAATSAIRNAAERAASGMAGGAAMDIGENNCIPAQLIPGRGAELAFQQLNILKPIKFKTGEAPGPRLTDALSREKMLYSGQSAMHAFAFKMQLTPPSFVSAADSVPVNRFVVHNVFRHVLAGPNNVSSAAYEYGPAQITWNQTLGPDKSYVRRGGANVGGTTGIAGVAGSAYFPPAASSGLDLTLQSPFRYPQNGFFMYSRMNRQLCENLGWNANPLKMVNVNSGTGNTTTSTALQVYANAAQDNGLGIVSSANAVPADVNLATTGPSFYYRSQQSRGQVSYNFNNDGTNPVVVEIVITRLKKGAALTKNELQQQMVLAYQNGYINYSSASKNQSNLNGQPPQAVDVTTNARGPFLPAKALDNIKLLSPIGAASASQQGPVFKQVARDQFIVSGGGTRNWSCMLQSLDYDARKYNQFQAAYGVLGVTQDTADNNSCCADDLTYIISIAVSGVPAPYVEFNSGTAYPSATAPVASVIDRRGTDCSVSVTGAYKEMCHPVYLTKALTQTMINGRLDIPHYDTTVPAPSLTSNDIASIGQAVRGVTTSSALIGLGPFNTVGGG